MRGKTKQQHDTKEESGKIIFKGQQSYVKLTDPLEEECAILSNTEIKLNSLKLLKIMQVWSFSRLVFDWPGQLNPLAHAPS